MSPYVCSQCGAGFTSLSAFDTHLDTDWDDPRGTTVCLDPVEAGLVWQDKVSGPARKGVRPRPEGYRMGVSS